MLKRSLIIGFIWTFALFPVAYLFVLIPAFFGADLIEIIMASLGALVVVSLPLILAYRFKNKLSPKSFSLYALGGVLLALLTWGFIFARLYT